MKFDQGLIVISQGLSQKIGYIILQENVIM